MNRSLALRPLLALSLLTAAAASHAITFVDDFENGQNAGGWSFFYGRENVVDETGGNSGAALWSAYQTPFGSIMLDTHGPEPHTEIGRDSPFTGNYVERGVTNLSIDVKTDQFFNQGVPPGRPFTLWFRYTNGTPFDLADDAIAYTFASESVPLPSEGWRRFSFDIDPTATSTPAGWNMIWLFGRHSTGLDWRMFVTDVEQVSFYYGDPQMSYFIHPWNTRVDNVSITYSPVPEPATLAALGLGAIAVLRRRRKA